MSDQPTASPKSDVVLRIEAKLEKIQPLVDWQALHIGGR
jgi:hypothetical protein